MLLEFTEGLVAWEIAILAVISLAVGVLGGMVGLALGTMRLPAMLLIGMEAGVAGGTNILVSTLSAMVGGFRHLREGRVDWRIVLYLGVPAIVGAFIGGFAASLVPVGVLVLGAGIFVAWQGIEFFLMVRKVSLVTPGSVIEPLDPRSVFLASKRGAVEAVLGFTVGLVGGAVGLILGSVRLPIIIRVMRADPRIAAGSNLMIGSFLGAFGFIGHGIQGELDLIVLAVMAVPAMVGTYLGARLTGRISVNGLLLVMAAVLLVVGILLIVNGSGRLAEG